MIFLRTNSSCNVGLGHLFRSLILVNELKKNVDEVIIVLDLEPKEEIKKLIKNYKVINLYNNNNLFQNEDEDAKLFSKIIKKYQSGNHLIIVDDYRLSGRWEKYVKSTSPFFKIIALDDTGKKFHNADFLIDAKWEKEKTKFRYKNLTSSKTIKLLGPNYILSSKINKKNSVKIENSNSILISIGGGGDASILINIIKTIDLHSNLNLKFSIYVILGPYLRGKNELKNIIIHNKLIKLIFIENELNINKYLRKCCLFVGAIGGTFYESNTLNIPAITFELSNNQKNKLSNLEDFGHYIHLGNLNNINFDKFGILINICLVSCDRLYKMLLIGKKIVNDGNGPKRIKEILKNNIYDDSLNEYSNIIKEKNKKNKKNILVKIDDTYINKYLEARNMIENRKNMLSKNKISNLDHYIWWFNSKRNNYVYNKDGIDTLFIWDEVINFNDNKYLIGGWFIYDKNCLPIDSYFCLHKQLEKCDLKYPLISWVACIKKDNIFVQKLNEKYGFKRLDFNSKLFNIGKEIFKNINLNQFNLYYREPKLN